MMLLLWGRHYSMAPIVAMMSAAGIEYGSETGRKLALLGATSLYLDFVNLFLFLLRLLGRRD